MAPKPAVLSRRCLSTPVLLLLLCLPAMAQAFLGNSSDDEFLPVEEAFPFSTYPENGTLVLDWEVTPEHYLYEDRLEIEVSPESALADGPTFSIESEHKDDPYFGDVQVFYDDVQARLEIDHDEPIDVSVTWQGCAEAGLCYPPETEQIRFDPDAGTVTHPAGDDEGGASAAPPSPDPDAQAPDTRGEPAAPEPDTTGGALSLAGLQDVLQHDSWMTIALVFYLLGLGLTFTPCVLPMIPIITAIVAGQRQLSTPQAFGLSLTYVLGMALTYAAAGVLVGLLGASFNVQAYLQSPWVLGSFAALFGLFALAMFGLFDLRMPQFLQDRLTQQSQRLSGGRVAGVFGIGSLSALIVSPCVTAPLAAALVYISATQDAVIGGTALFGLGLGMGTPLLVVGTGGQRFMPKAGPWMDGIKAFFGVLMLGVAIWLLERIIPGPAALGLWALLLAVSAVQLGAFEPVKSGWARTRKGLGLVLFLVSAMLLAGAMAGANDPLRPLAPFQASSGGGSGTDAGEAEPFERIDDSGRITERLEAASAADEPVILDFTADWCISCRIMERRVFSDPEVLDTMSGYTRLQADVTDNDATDQQLLERYGLFGPPSLLFFDSDGEEVEGSRVVGEMNRSQFLSHLEQVNERIEL